MHDDRFSHLPQIIDPQGEASAPLIANGPAIMPSVLAGALALWTKLPGIDQLRASGRGCLIGLVRCASGCHFIFLRDWLAPFWY
jgi:hypothetical protein